MSNDYQALPASSAASIDPAAIVIGGDRSEPAAQPATTSNVVPFRASGEPEGGKGGKPVNEEPDDGLQPASPPLPPSPQAAAEDRRDVGFVADGIYTPAPRRNPVLAAFREQGAYIEPLGSGRHAVTCPWAHDHPEGDTGSATYVEPAIGIPNGRFECPHHEGDRKGIHDVLDRFDIDHQRARCKPRITVKAGEQNLVLRAAEYALARDAGYFQSNGSIVTIRWDTARKDVAVELVNEQMMTKALSSAADWEKNDGRSKGFIPCDPPIRITQMLAKAQSYEFLPVLKGVARQPYFRASDRKLILRSGFDAQSGIYASFNESAFQLSSFTRRDAELALNRLRFLISEMHFKSEVDRSALISAMLTATVRPTLPHAPAFNITAPASGSGKSYASNLVNAFATAGSPLVMSYPVSTDEASKAMLAALLQAPAVIFFDDMQTDWLPFGVMNRMLTSETISERILGSSRVVTANTATLVMGTGNNILPARDMNRRVLSVHLNAPSATPMMLRYDHDPVAAVRADRESFVCAALTIIRAWQEAGSPKADVPPIGSFGQWSDMCRQPLLWLGLPDPAESLIEQVRNDPDAVALSAFLEAWADHFGTQPVTVRKLVDQMHASSKGDLAEAVLDLPVMEKGFVNRSKLGWFLKKNVDRIVGNRVIRRAESLERTAWSVQWAGNGAGR